VAQGAKRILFITSNGTGLGHLTRSMAIARRLPPDGVESLFITLSAAAPVVRSLGFPVEYIASYGTPGSGNDYRWSRRLRARLRAAIEEIDPAVLVFDGTHPYEPLLGAFRDRSDTTAVWCRRPLWKRGADRAPLARAGAFDAVLEPGELAESEDRGPTAALRGETHRVGPIVLLDRSELLPRDQAERELGLQPERTNVLVTLGQGAEVREATERILTHLANRGDVQVAALRSTIAGGAGDRRLPDGIVELRATYPMSRHFAAFDVAVSAAGYNAFHELIALGVPSLFVPMHRQTDDQPARARWAERQGLACGAESATDPGLERLLDELLDPDARAGIADRLRELEPAAGAAEASGWLAAGPETGPRRPASDRGQKEFRRRWTQFLRYAPRTALRLARQQLTQPRPRTLLLALGNTGDTPAAVRGALTQTPDPPERVLVITDSLQLAPLRELGVGIEHVPGPGERQPELARGDYDAFLRHRLDLILAERPRPKRVLTAPGCRPPPPRIAPAAGQGD
jgi:UDP:flavonoid glycosyltransferase YjiC (YdhE family)